MSIGGIIAFVMFTAPVDVATLGQLRVSESLNDAVYTPAARAAVRHQNSDYEKLLGEFDVHADFNERLRLHAKRCSHLDITIAAEPTINIAIIDAIKDSSIRDATRPAAVLPPPALAKLQAADAPRVLGLKYSYGLGAKAGVDQLGLTKSYRPFVKLIGVLVDTESGQVLWRDLFIEFGYPGYRGNAAAAKNLDGKELQVAFEALNDLLANSLVNSLNGAAPHPIPFLVGLSPEVDYRF